MKRRTTLAIALPAFAAGVGLTIGCTLLVTGQDSAQPAVAPSPSSMLDAAQTLSPQVLTTPDGTVYLPVDTARGWEYDGRTYYPIDPAAVQVTE